MIKKISDERGFVSHIMKINDENYRKLVSIWEIYASCCYPGKIKGWHYHTKMDMVYTCVSGMVQIAYAEGPEPSTYAYAGAIGSRLAGRNQYPAREDFKTVFIGDQNYDQVFIPHGTWNAFRAIGEKPAIIINVTNMVHDPQEILRQADNLFNYKWDYHT